MEKSRKGTPRPGPRQPRFSEESKDSIMLKVREAKGLTQEQMAELLGCNPQTVRRCEWENKLPKNKGVMRVLKAAAGSVGIEIEG